MSKSKNYTTIVGASSQMQHVFRLVEKVARTDGTVLVTGKSGTGKELVARAIHAKSSRRDMPFVAINCGAIAPTLMESELFGYWKGAFTGATQNKEGYFKYADRGTLLLDEVAEFPPDLQVKLLRALETREILPVGGTRPDPVDARIIAATNRDLAAEVERGNFREDLFYRLNVVEINIPALSERRDDIPLLVDHFIGEFNRQFNRTVSGATDEAMAKMMSHEWRGGVRELENAIERSMTLCEDDVITERCLPPSLGGRAGGVDTLDLRESMARYEKKHIEDVLARAGGDKHEASRLLGIGLSSLYRKIDEHGIQ